MAARDFRLLAYFVDAGGLRAAARRLSLSPPVLSAAPARFSRGDGRAPRSARPRPRECSWTTAWWRRNSPRRGWGRRRRSARRVAADLRAGRLARVLPGHAFGLVVVRALARDR